MDDRAWAAVSIVIWICVSRGLLELALLVRMPRLWCLILPAAVAWGIFAAFAPTVGYSNMSSIAVVGTLMSPLLVFGRWRRPHRRRRPEQDPEAGGTVGS